MSSKTLLIIIAAVVFLLGGSALYNRATANYSKLATKDLCIQHKNLAAHYHPELEIFINGEKQEIPAEVGVTASCMRAVHTHDASGKIHVETPDKRRVYLKDFFEVWGQPFDSEHILDKTADETNRVVMRVDGKESQEYGNLVLKDGQKIVISFEEKERPVPILAPAP